jgi:hypothetical protein
MKQLLSLFLFLLPCLAWAQYPSNGNQKITLGEQTSADGLIFRGVLADTGIITPLSDTSAYIILDTVNHRFYNYNRATNVWSVAGGGTAVTTFSGGTTGLTPSTATSGAVTLAGTLAVANGGTNATTLTANKVIVGNGTSGVLTPTNLHWDNTNSRLGIGTSSPTTRLTVQGDYANFTNGTINIYAGSDGAGGLFGTITDHYQRFITNNFERLRISSAGIVSIGTSTPQSGYRLHVVDSVYVGGNVSASAYTTRSDFNLKDDIFDLKYGLNDILQLQPVEYTYKSNGSKQLGFIAQDIGTILPEVVSFEESMSVNYQAIIPILTKAIQQQQAQIEALKQRLLILENK